MKSTHSGRLERWLGPARVEHLSSLGRGWYGPPIHVLDIPGSVRVCGDGDFVGPFERGFFYSAADALRDHGRRLMRAKASYSLSAGFAGVQDYIDRARHGYAQSLPYCKTLTTTSGAGNSGWAMPGNPVAGAAGSAAPGGRACDVTTTGAFQFNNPSTGTTHLTGWDNGNTVVTDVYLLYDRLFDVAKTMSSTATEAVTGVPTRYQSQTATDPDYIGGNFVFPETTSVLGGVNHNWTVCQYTDQAGNTAQSFPSAGAFSGAAAGRIDLSGNIAWFMPLATGDTGVKALTQMQCSASVTGGVTFVVGHPIGFCAFPLQRVVFPVDWITNRSLAPRVFDSACLAFLIPITSGAGSTMSGVIELTNAP